MKRPVQIPSLSVHVHVEALVFAAAHMLNVQCLFFEMTVWIDF